MDFLLKYLYYPGVDISLSEIDVETDMQMSSNTKSGQQDARDDLLIDISEDDDRYRSKKTQHSPGPVRRKLENSIIKHIVGKPLASAEEYLHKIRYHARIVESDDTPMLLHNNYDSHRVNVCVAGELEIIDDGSDDPERAPYFG